MRGARGRSHSCLVAQQTLVLKSFDFKTSMNVTFSFICSLCQHILPSSQF